MCSLLRLPSAWLPARDLSSLKEKEIDAFINGPGKKKADLMQGYTIAKDPTDWITAKDDEAAEHAKLEQDLMDAAENDELASDDEPATKKKGAKKDATKKRKRETNAAANGAKKDDKKKPKKDTAKTKVSRSCRARFRGRSRCRPSPLVSHTGRSQEGLHG